MDEVPRHLGHVRTPHDANGPIRQRRDCAARSIQTQLAPRDRGEIRGDSRADISSHEQLREAPACLRRRHDELRGRMLNDPARRDSGGWTVDDDGKQCCAIRVGRDALLMLDAVLKDRHRRLRRGQRFQPAGRASGLMGFGSEEDPGNWLDGVGRRDDARCRPQDARRPFDNERVEGCSDTEHDVVPACRAEACRDDASNCSNPDDGDDTHWEIAVLLTWAATRSARRQP